MIGCRYIIINKMLNVYDTLRRLRILMGLGGCNNDLSYVMHSPSARALPRPLLHPPRPRTLYTLVHFIAHYVNAHAFPYMACNAATVR